MVVGKGGGCAGVLVVGWRWEGVCVCGWGVSVHGFGCLGVDDALSPSLFLSLSICLSLSLLLFLLLLLLFLPEGWMKKSTVLIPLPSLIKKKNRSFVRSFSLSLFASLCLSFSLSLSLSLCFCLCFCLCLCLSVSVSLFSRNGEWRKGQGGEGGKGTYFFCVLGTPARVPAARVCWHEGQQEAVTA